MARVICTRPNASEEISGVKFTKHEQGMLSAEITDQLAAAFIEIRGYELAGADGVQAEAKPTVVAPPAQAAVQAPVPQAQAAAPAGPDPAEAQRQAEAAEEEKRQAAAQAEGQRQAAEAEAREIAAITDEMKALGAEVKGNWKLTRLKAELKRAKEEKAAADAAAADAATAAAGDQGKSE